MALYFFAVRFMQIFDVAASKPVLKAVDVKITWVLLHSFICVAFSFCLHALSFVTYLLDHPCILVSEMVGGGIVQSSLSGVYFLVITRRLAAVDNEVDVQAFSKSRN